MQWHSLSEFFAMGGRGGFVWGAYGTMALLMAVELLLACGPDAAMNTVNAR